MLDIDLSHHMTDHIQLPRYSMDLVELSFNYLYWILTQRMNDVSQDIKVSYRSPGVTLLNDLRDFQQLTIVVFILSNYLETHRYRLSRDTRYSVSSAQTVAHVTSSREMPIFHSNAHIYLTQHLPLRPCDSLF